MNSGMFSRSKESKERTAIKALKQKNFKKKEDQTTKISEQRRQKRRKQMRA